MAYLHAPPSIHAGPRPSNNIIYLDPTSLQGIALQCIYTISPIEQGLRLAYWVVSMNININSSMENGNINIGSHSKPRPHVVYTSTHKPCSNSLTLATPSPRRRPMAARALPKANFVCTTHIGPTLVLQNSGISRASPSWPRALMATGALPEPGRGRAVHGLQGQTPLIVAPRLPRENIEPLLASGQPEIGL